MTESDASDHLREKIQALEHHASATLWLRTASGRSYTVLGAVNKPGLYPLPAGTRLAQALAAAGGVLTASHEGELIEQADLAAAQLVRNSKTLPVSPLRAMSGDPKHNIYLYPDDMLYIPPSQNFRITVLGEVKQPQTIAYRRGIRLTEALARAGGLSDDSDDGDVRIIRGPLAKPKIYRASIEDLVAGKLPDVELAPGDVVFVTEHWFASATDVVRRLVPALVGAGAAAVIAK
jgi:polysaccharide export outer membrane protein